MGDANKWKMIESEMDRFEAEISSLTSQPAFVPSQIKRPPGPATTAAFVSAAPIIRKPAPVVISAAPQKYAGPDIAPRQPLQPALRPTSIGSVRLGTSMIPSTLQPTHVRPPIPGGSAAATVTGAKPSVITPGPSTSVQQEPPKATTSADTQVAKKKKKKKKDQDGKPKKVLRSAGGQVWEDTTLTDWDPSDFRLFCGDLGNDVTDEVLTRVFGRYPSFQKAKVVRDRRTNKTKGYGFVSFKDPNDFVRAIRELDGRYVGSRPIKLRKSNWKNRNLDQAKKRDKERNQLLGIQLPNSKPK